MKNTYAGRCHEKSCERTQAQIAAKGGGHPALQRPKQGQPAKAADEGDGQRGTQAYSDGRQNAEHKEQQTVDDTCHEALFRAAARTHDSVRGPGNACRHRTD